MSRFYLVSILILSIALFLSLSVKLDFSRFAFGARGDKGCPVNMVRVGPLCVDTYEATVWSEPSRGNGNPRGIQFGVTEDDYTCSDNGNDCSASAANPIFAASLPGVTPSAFITWFQAQQACANVGKRLLRNGEWQMAAAGTPTDYEPDPDDGVDDCNTSTAGGVVDTGSRSNCVSNFGVFDMVGNLQEWVEDWTQDSSDSDGGDTSSALYGSDAILGVDEAAPETDRFPAALIRGGHWLAGTFAGVFELSAARAPSSGPADTDCFRCARNP